MLNDKTINEELTRAKGEHKRLMDSIALAERDAQRSSRKIQAAKRDIETAERNLEKQKSDYERVLREFKYADEELLKLKNKEADYKRKIVTLESQLRTILKEMEKGNRR